jgi:glycosyltransferase involved in cell wall biosynthesis
MSKPLLVYQAPIATRSGYGDHARDLLRALKELDLYDIKIISTRWGATAMDQLNPLNAFDTWILQNIIPQPPPNVDVYVQVTVPNEFQRLGKVNIGVTAGIESTVCAKDWIDGCNRMDLIIATSEHAKRVLQQTVYQERRRDTNQVVNEFKINVPIESLFEGIDYKQTDGLAELDNIKEEFCFLFVGHWLQGELYEDRKDVGGLLQTFLASFGKSKGAKPALILKTSMVGFSVRDREEIQRRVASIKQTVAGEASVYLLHGDLTEDDMWKLYNHNKVKAMVSFTHGEGFGRPLLEFSLTGKPVIASGWSGQIDFLKEGAVLLEGQLKNIHPSAANQFLLKEAQWFHVNYSNAALKLVDVYNNYKTYLDGSTKLAEINKVNFSFNAMKNELNNICTKYVKVPSRVELKLPTLKKINLPSLKKIEQ